MLHFRELIIAVQRVSLQEFVLKGLGEIEEHNTILYCCEFSALEGVGRGNHGTVLVKLGAYNGSVRAGLQDCVAASLIKRFVCFDMFSQQ